MNYSKFKSSKALYIKVHIEGISSLYFVITINDILFEQSIAYIDHFFYFKMYIMFYRMLKNINTFSLNKQ